VEIVGFIVMLDHFVVDGVQRVLKMIMSATIGEKGFLKDSFVIFVSHG
jgi:hypothetical protein